MSFLTPFYILGALAIAGPIVFHLIRRTPRGEVRFSSLMFLTATPPRLTRRTRLDNLPLLLLRAAALALLALAFARPFLREAASLNLGDPQRRRVVLLIDTSASMRRGDLWARAKALADRAIADSRPGDELAVLAFDSSTRTLMGFAESATLEPARRRAVARAGLGRLEPSWGSSDLGQALVDAVGAIEDAAEPGAKSGRIPRRVVLVGDLQQGSRLDALGDFEWPADVELDLKPVTAEAPNAGPQWLADAEPTSAEPDQPLRVRVTNDSGAKVEAFTLAWLDAEGNDLGPAVPAYVPPGESRVVKVPRAADRHALRLRGDAQRFDNTLYRAATPRGTASVLFVGNDAPDDPNGLLYYLQRVFEDSPSRTVRVASKGPAEAIHPEADRSLRLVVLAAETSPENAARWKTYARAGGTVLVIPAPTAGSATLGTLADVAPPPIEESPDRRDAMLGEIDFGHPLFAPLAGAQFNDFTKVRFWKHRRLGPAALGPARVVARFEGGDPAVIEKAVGQGRLVVFASGWAPLDSQLARSTKFLPMMASLLEGREPPPVDSSSHKVGDKVPLPADQAKLTVRKPEGKLVAVDPGATSFAETDRPGVYTIEGPGEPRAFAVNLDPAESRTPRLAPETFEQLGCKLARTSPGAVDRDLLRQMRNAELEGRQKLWRGLILAVIGILILETFWAGRLGRPRAEALAS